jgi:hypothetical protein
MWLTDREKLGLKQLSPPAYACRSAEELVTVIGPVCTFISAAIGCIVTVHGRMDEGASFFALGALQAWLTLVLAESFSAGELIWLKHRHIRYDEGADDYVRDTEPLPWGHVVLRLVHAALFTVPGRLYRFWLNGPLTREAHLSGSMDTRVLDIRLQRGDRALVDLRNDTGELGAHGFVTTGRWSREEGSQALTVTLYRGKQLLQLLPLEDGTYAVQHEGAIRVRAWSMTGLRLRLPGQACLAR